MNRTEYFNYIEEKLSLLSLRIKNRGKINLLDLNIHSETFFADLMNYLLGYNLKNINQVKQNTDGIDLIDHKNKIVVQVSSTCTKQKIENSLAKKIFDNLHNYRFKFVAIVGDASKLREKAYKNPYNVSFDPLSDILDIKNLLSVIINLKISDQRILYEFIRNELGSDIDIVKVDSNLTTIINLLSQENLSCVAGSPEINQFEIQRKIEFNDLLNIKSTIDDYKIYYSKLDEKYREFDKQGSNKSISIFFIMRSIYNKQIEKHNNPRDVFFAVIDETIQIIKNSKNYIEIPYEELEMCVSILVVDAFVRCKIFKNPEGYNYVAAR